MKVLWGLGELGLPFERIDVGGAFGKTDTPDYRAMNRPLIISDCDEVLLHMVVPFRSWLDESHGIHFDFSSSFEEALRHKDSGDRVERSRFV